MRYYNHQHMVHSTRAIANYFIQKGIAEGRSLTLMQLLKLVYFAHGWSMALRDQPLINENFQAWMYGPVLQSIYSAAKKYGSNPVKELLVGDFDVFPELPELDADEEKLLEAVWGNYGKLHAYQLSNMTHEDGSPWHQVWVKDGGANRKGAIIENNLIKEFFLNRRKKVS